MFYRMRKNNKQKFYRKNLFHSRTINKKETLGNEDDNREEIVSIIQQNAVNVKITKKQAAKALKKIKLERLAGHDEVTPGIL